MLVLSQLLTEIRRCRACASALAHEPRPILQAAGTARICIAGQAPGRRAHESGVPYADASGERLRAWIGVGKDIFYDERLVAIVPMGFCFPGYDASGADLPPRRECASLWHDRLFALLPKFKLILAVGRFAQHYHLKEHAKKSVAQTVQAWREYGDEIIPLPHPSWHNHRWLKTNPWFEAELLPHLRERVQAALSSGR